MILLPGKRYMIVSRDGPWVYNIPYGTQHTMMRLTHRDTVQVIAVFPRDNDPSDQCWFIVIPERTGALGRFLMQPETSKYLFAEL